MKFILGGFNHQNQQKEIESMGQLLKNHDHLLENYEKRLETLESKHRKLWDTILSALISAVVTRLVAAISKYFLL